MAKRQKKAPGGANWMDTYGDMVTLLLCFFVLLYSMSSISEEKWKIIVKSFNPNAVETSQIVTTTEPNDNLEDPVEGSHDPAEIQETFDELYRQLVQYVEQNNYQNDIELSKGDDYTFITFRDNVFFDGESYNIRPEGQHILDGICEALATASASIDEVRVLGHTSQATPGVPNEPVSDRFLASNRATEVLLYIQTKNIMEPRCLVAVSYGQFRAISDVDTREGRARNRRVELLITRKDSDAKSLDQYYKEIKFE